ncbi:hypothetical protein NX059_001992 [Plenodomus lindquistii]|nr:hypothetical protein NX059_001992 [Plenodomus lindquistii]
MSLQHSPAADSHMHGEFRSRLPSFATSLDGSMNSFAGAVQTGGSVPVFGMGNFQNALPQPEAIRPTLSLLTDVGRKYPGFPTPLSPTPSAKAMFPSPASEAGSSAPTPRAATPLLRTISPISIGGVTHSGSVSNHEAHDYDFYGSQITSIDNILVSTRTDNDPQFFPDRWAIRSPPRVPSTSTLSVATTPNTPSSPTRCISPRTAMLKTIANKRAFQNTSHNSSLYPASRFQPSMPLSPSIQIANGTETNTASPIDPSGTMLLYTSNRSVDSGLLGLRPLSETQVAEYRFWRPCGKRICAFGCGGAQEGEWAAAKRLFKDVEDVDADVDIAVGCEQNDSGAQMGFGVDGVNEADSCIDSGYGSLGSGLEKEQVYAASAWAGRRMVKDWNTFLRSCEREGIARV